MLLECQKLLNVSRQLQGISMDLAVAANLVTSCRDKFMSMRNDQNVDSLWKQIVQQAHTFATKHSIDTRITERRKTRKLMDSETARDETRDGDE